MDLEEIEGGNMDQIHVTENRAQWQVLVNMVVNIWIP
jgi:hypothetical protein